MKRTAINWLSLLLVVQLPIVADAQFIFTTNNGTLTIKAYTGPGGNVVIPSVTNGLSVTRIGDLAFNCTTLTSIILPDSIVSIGDGAFNGCSALTNIALNAHLKTIGGSAFSDTSLTRVTIPAGVTNIGSGAFTISRILTNITVNPLNPVYRGIGGVLFNKTGKILVEVPGGIYGTYTISNGVTGIAPGAFLFSGLTNVIIPISVRTIGDSAFSWCDGLTSVIIPPSVTNIDANAFANCSHLALVYFGGTPPVIDGSVFDGDPYYLAIIYLPDATGWSSALAGRRTEPGSPYPFSIIITNGTVVITQLQIQYYQPNPAIVPATMFGLPVVGVGGGAFAERGQLPEVLLPNSITSIGSNAFRYCYSLTNVSLGSGVTNIGDGAFASCGRLASIVVPNRVTRIADSLFYSCSGLTNVVLSTNVTSIGDSAFYNCMGLTSLTLPKAVTTIENNAFELCYYLTNFSLGTNVTHLGAYAFAYCGSLTHITIPNKITNIADGLFAGCFNLRTAILPGGLRTIGNSAFRGCGLRQMTIGAAVRSIGDGAFAYCGGLTSLRVPASVNHIGQYAFFRCMSLTNLAVDSLNPVYSSLNGVMFDRSQTTLIQFPAGKGGNYTVTGTVTNIQDFACHSSPLTSVVIPKNVLRIGAYAFGNCIDLTNITVDPLNPNFSSLDGVLFNREQNAILQFPCGRVGNYSIATNVTGIGQGAFYVCRGFASITVPGGITNIGLEAFAACPNLTNIAVSPLNPHYSSRDGILFNKTQTALIQCPAGTAGSYSIPEGVWRIEDWAFENCASLASLIVPATVTSIGSGAFQGCTNLTGVYFKGDAPADDSTEFDGDYLLWVYYLPWTSGWGFTYGNSPASLWYLPNPMILTSGGNFGLQNQQFSFTVFWATNTSVVVEACTDLSAGDWSTVQTINTAGGLAGFADPQYATFPSRYYRLRSGP